GFLPALLGRQPRAVSIHTSSRRSFYRSFVYVALARLCGRPIVLHVHPSSFIDFHARAGRVGRFLIDWAVAGSDQVIVLTDSIREAFRPVAAGSKVRVIPNPVDTEEHRPSPGGPPASGPVVLYMGWIIPAKGVFDLVEAIPAVREAVPGVVFKFAGNKEVQRLRDLIRARQLDAAASVLGWVSGGERLALLRESHLLVLPTYSEGLPNVLLEAMASGLPVLTTPVGGIPGLVEDGRNGVFVTPGDVPGLASAITRLLREEPLRRQLAVNARATIEAHYSLDAVGRQLAATYSRYLTPALPGMATS
ncbi:MAG: glycosyltransferase family 4 protein, partial [Gammaproteobacteria bacterium]|nr:glycosyltransferase family 4 protein [Gammaproteobacteria bacterium]